LHPPGYLLECRSLQSSQIFKYVSMTPSAKPDVVVVLGMHRSGTSFLTKSLELLGVGLGDRLMEPAGDNPKGFWDDQEVVDINIEILKTQDADFADLRFKLPTKDSESTLQPLFDRAVTLVSNRISTFSRWAFKDPRTCRTIAFWRAAIEAAGASPKFVIAIRNPLEVAASLRSRNELPTIHGLYSWLQHTIPAFTETQGFPRVVVEYEEILSDPRKQLARIGNALSLPLPNHDSPEMQAYSQDFLDTSMRHHCSTLEDLSGDAKVPREVIEVYQIARRVARDEESIDGSVVSEKLQWAQSHLTCEAPLFDWIHELTERVHNLEGRAYHLEVELEQSRASIAHLSAVQTELSTANKHLSDKLSSVLSSHSWKVTSPLRAVVDTLQRFASRSARESL